MMRDDIILAAVVIVAASTVMTAFGVVWLCGKVSQLKDHACFAEMMASLGRIEGRFDLSEVKARLTSQQVDVAAELGYQNAAANAVVAGNLADSIARADAQPTDSDYGAAADAALRSAESTE